jgi:hypothetical protein
VSIAILALVLVAGGGWAVARGDLSGRSAAAVPEVPTGTATVTRSDVAERQQVAGTIGYSGSYTVVGQSQDGGADGASGAAGPTGGIVTRLPAPGEVLDRGRAVYELDGHPVPLLYGARPAWRTFRLGMADGPDVRQLEANLVVLGFDPGRAVTVDGRYGWATAAAGNPRVVLADEPTGNLDSATSANLVTLLQALNRQGVTLVVVTHDQDVAGAMSRQVEVRDGQVVGDSGSGRP